jgi:glycine hydroxymethyltransferase
VDSGPFEYAARLEAILRDHQEFRRHIVPLCAAETPISDFVRSFVSHPIHESYAMGGPLRPALENFIGAEHVLNLHQLTIDLCRAQFGAAYADPRPLSGTGAVTTLLMTLSQPGQRILLQTQDSGGHSSMGPICRRLGLEVLDVPYDYDRLDIDVDACRRLSEERHFDFVLFAPSDLIYPPRLEACGFPGSTTVIYDATQTLGLIATGHVPSPLEQHPRSVVTAGTHKTLPGPSSGLILTKNDEIADRVDAQLSPKFVRHSHPHHMAALCAALIEHAAVGPQYSDRIRVYTQILSRSLTEMGVAVIEDHGRSSETHQVFVHVPRAELQDRYARAAGAGITLNMKHRRLFQYSGIRLGVQEIARYRWTESDVAALAPLLAGLLCGDDEVAELRERVLEMARLNSFDPAMTISVPV